MVACFLVCFVTVGHVAWRSFTAESGVLWAVLPCRSCFRLRWAPGGSVNPGPLTPNSHLARGINSNPKSSGERVVYLKQKCFPRADEMFPRLPVSMQVSVPFSVPFCFWPLLSSLFFFFPLSFKTFIMAYLIFVGSLVVGV